MQLASLVSGSAEVTGPEATLAEAAEWMVSHGVDALAVISDRSLVGLFTEHDLARAVAGGADVEGDVVSEWMTEGPDTFSPDTSVYDALAWLLETGYRHLPVTGDGELLGVVGVRDLMWAMAQST